MADRLGPQPGKAQLGPTAGPELPYEKAFVVQFTAATDPRLEHAEGRVEHMRSGRRIRFASIADLLTSIAYLLSSDGSEPPEESEPAEKRSGRGPKDGPGKPPSP